MNMSFFVDPHFIGAQIRGKQIAQHLGAKYNHVSGYENDVCVHVKPLTLDHIRDGDWVDISDGNWIPNQLKTRPKVKAISHSLYMFNFLSKRLPNELNWISQQHLNWERALRTHKEINTCGYIGMPSHWARRVYNHIAGTLKNWSFIACYNFPRREHCIDFYKSIDLLIVGPSQNKVPYKTPTKLINAASFGIPSIAQKLPGYEEWEGNYVPAATDQIAAEAEKFRDPSYYADWSSRLTAAAEPYHISRVAELYRMLS